MKIAVCDDEKATREQITSLIKAVKSDIEVVAFASGDEMIKSKENFAVYFLDVEMQGTSGIDVAKYIRDEQERNGTEKSIIIFITGHREYMESAFDVNAFHYLVKPIDEDKFNVVFNRALKEVSAKEKRQKHSIVLKHNGMQKKVLLKDIYYIESSNKKVVFYTKDGKLDTYGKMEEWEKELGNSFYRCHRGYLVNMEKITAYSTDTIEVVGGDLLILARKKYSDFIKAYMRYAKDGGIVNV